MPWMLPSYSAANLFTKEATKITLGQPVMILNPHGVKAVLELKDHIA
jgi:hypothetical protein